jgi:hypothetical protein
MLKSTISHIGSANGKPNRYYRRRRRRMRDGQCLAALRAFNAAKGVQNGTFRTITEAALACGSCRHYVAAALTLLKAEAHITIDLVLGGELPVVSTAKAARRLADLVAAYRNATGFDRSTFGHLVGAEDVFERVVVPALD